MRFLVDENVSPCLAFILAEWGYDSDSILLRGMESAPDAVVLDAAIAEDRIVITFNGPDYEVLHAALLDSDGHHPGIVICRQVNYQGFSKLLAQMRLMLDTFGSPADYADKVRYSATF